MTSSTTALAHERVISRAASGGAIDNATIVDAVRSTAPLLGDGDHSEAVAEVIAAAGGLGPLEEFLHDPDVTDLMVNGDGRVWIERLGSIAATPLRISPDQTLRIIERVVAPLGLKIDRLNATVDARLSDGSRVHAVIPPLAVDGPCLTIRRFRVRALPLGEFTTPPVAALLASAVTRGANVVVSGGTGTGKTTLLNALAAAIPRGDRVVTIEDTAELRLDHPHVVRLETRAPTAEGIGGCTARQLLREALRMRPDRIIVGECRGAEALEMVMAMNTGHSGSMSTCHANDAAGALRRLATLCLFAESGAPLEALTAEVATAVDLVVQVGRSVAGGRAIESVVEVAPGALTPIAAAGELTGGGALWV